MHEDAYIRIKSYEETLMGYFDREPSDEEYAQLANKILDCSVEISGTESGYYPFLMNSIYHPAQDGFSKDKLEKAFDSLVGYTEQWTPWEQEEKKEETNEFSDTPLINSPAVPAQRVQTLATNKPFLEKAPTRTRYCEYDVFLSYATDEKNEADSYREAFARENIKCFMAGHNIEPGSEWLKRIRLALLTSGIFVALMSKKSYRRPWVLTEIGGAWLLGLPMIPVVKGIDFDQLTSPLSNCQGYKMNNIDDFNAFISHVSRIVSDSQLHGYPVPSSI